MKISETPTLSFAVYNRKMIRELIPVVAIASCLLILVGIEMKVVAPTLQESTLISRLIGYHPVYDIIVDDEENPVPMKDNTVIEEKKTEEESTFPQFTVIIVTFNEPLLYKTMNNVLENTNPKYLKELLVIDDQSTPPVVYNGTDPRVRIYRSDERLGLIKARFTGGEEARGEYLAFIDAHVFVGPNWLTTPHRLLTEDLKTIVNFINFSLDAEKYIPQKAWRGIGSSASITTDLHQFWGGGSKTDDTSPITMGMFATTKYWWNQGKMDPQLKTWGGENVEISLRTWLCGGRIVVARDSFVAHGFRTRFPYKVNGGDVVRNYIRIANVWLEEEYRKVFYNVSNVVLNKQGVPVTNFGNITERLELKKKLNCKPFKWYVEKFEGRAWCLTRKYRPEGYHCGTVMTVNPNDLDYLTYEQMFYKNESYTW